MSDRDAGFKQPLERCKLLTRWAFEYFDQTRRYKKARVATRALMTWLREVMLAVYEGSSSSTGTTCFAASPTFWASRIRAFSSGVPFRTTMPDDGSKNFFSFCILCG